MKVLDPHVHFIDVDRFSYPWMQHPDHAPLRHDYSPADLLGDAGGGGIELVGAVHVQAEVDHALDPVAETAWVGELAESGQLPVPCACIGYADLLAPGLDELLDRHAAHPVFRGIRQEAWCDPDSDRAEFLERDILGEPQFERGLRAIAARDLCFDLLVFPRQLSAAARTFSRLPELPVALEHSGVPASTPEGLASWRRGMREFAGAAPGARLKISAMGFISPDWRLEEIRPIVLEALEIFGVERCMFASNFPVESVARDYGGVWAAFAAVTADLSEAERDALFVENARRFYRL